MDRLHVSVNTENSLTWEASPGAVSIEPEEAGVWRCRKFIFLLAVAVWLPAAGKPINSEWWIWNQEIAFSGKEIALLWKEVHVVMNKVHHSKEEKVIYTEYLSNWDVVVLRSLVYGRY